MGVIKKHREQYIFCVQKYTSFSFFTFTEYVSGYFCSNTTVPMASTTVISYFCAAPWEREGGGLGREYRGEEKGRGDVK